MRTGRDKSRQHSTRLSGPIRRAGCGTVLPGERDLEPDRNSVQTLVAVKRNGAWQLEAFQNSRAQFMGRPDEIQALADELRQLL